jgi:hypothetical protein
VEEAWLAGGERSGFYAEGEGDELITALPGKRGAAEEFT